jgi:hypothetical protein
MGYLPDFRAIANEVVRLLPGVTGSASLRISEHFSERRSFFH